MTYPLNPKHQRYADRLRQLIQEGNEVAKLERVYYVNSGPSIRGSDQILVKSWSVKTFNILKLVFGEDSTHYKQLEELMRRNPHIESSYDIYPINGILVAALDDLENGYLPRHEFIVAGELFSTVLEQAKYLNSISYKDVAAMLGRVVIEDCLRRLSREEGLDDKVKASVMNQNLRKADRYGQFLWRRIDALLDIGNAAAHGEFGKYTQDDVEAMLVEIERFLANELRY